MDDLERLGRPGAYRLGLMRGFEPDPPPLLRPSFTRPGRGGRVLARVLAGLAAAAAIAGSAAGLLVLPVIAGLLAGAWLAAALAARWAGRVTMRPGDAATEAGEDAAGLVRMLSGSGARRG
jgi:hypothetical protein